MKSNGSEICELLPWDSEFFGHRIGRVRANSLNPTQVTEVDAWAAQHEVECLYFLAQSECANTLRVAESNNFRLADVRITLEHTLSDKKDRSGQQSPRIRSCENRDLPFLKELAASAHTGTRFYNDPHFAKDKAQQLYSIWIQKECTDCATHVFVATAAADQPCGYVSCHLNEAGDGQIGLIAVAAESQGQGIGRELVCAALEWFASKNAGSVSVVTQLSNIPAQRLYQSMGFLMRTSQFWFHKWYEGNPRT